MAHNTSIPAVFRRQTLTRDADGYAVWCVNDEPVALSPAATALVLCDVWDHHWCRGAEQRLAPMLGRMNDVAESLRARGVLIVHAPSDTIDDAYAGTPARLRVLAAPRAEPPADLPFDPPPSPIDAADGGSDTDADVAAPSRVWTAQHSTIRIDHDSDAISADGRELYSLYRHRGIDTVLIMGVHTNMCILGRSFAIKQMVRWAFPRIALVRDLTDTMYNPARSPYVSHDEGTRLVVEYIEKFWCPTVVSDDLLAGGSLLQSVSGEQQGVGSA